MPEIVKKQLTAEWHAAHIGRISSGTAPGCLRLCPYTSPQKAWRRIMGTEPHIENQWTRWGTEMEATARFAYECETGRLVRETGFWVHPEMDFLGASPDGLIGDDGILECKCPENLPTAVSPGHRIQMSVQMIVTGRKWCDYFAWTPKAHFLARVTLRGERGLTAKLRKFYERHVATGTPPPRKKRRPRRETRSYYDIGAAINEAIEEGFLCEEDFVGLKGDR